MEDLHFEAITETPYSQFARFKVESGWIYKSHTETERGLSESMVFVPDLDLKRYQSHLRDAYTQGYKDGQEDAKNGVVNPDEGLVAY